MVVADKVTCRRPVVITVPGDRQIIQIPDHSLRPSPSPGLYVLPGIGIG